MAACVISTALRRISPALIDTKVYSCLSMSKYPAAFSTSTPVHDDSPNKDYKVNPLFQNRNPRNLEEMGLARKRQGWVLQSPRKDYYHRITLERTNRHTTGRVQHFSGKTVISASTTEWAIRDGLYSLVDVSAAENVGRVLAQRCLECGITNVFFEQEDEQAGSEKLEAFLEGVQALGLSLEEQEVLERKFTAGIDYSKENRIGEEKRWKDDYQPL